jgi:Lar family restriction alleviation protein
METTLKPCPFCGGKAHFHIGEHVFFDVKIQCEICGTEGPLFDTTEENYFGDHEKRDKNMKDALEHWNRRV